MSDAANKVVLHVGCGPANPQKLHPLFRDGSWREVRLDINPAVQPDVIASTTDMRAVSDASADAVWSSHNLEHLFAHEVPAALAEFRRVLRPGGFVLITLPDLQTVCEQLVQRGPLAPLYQSPAGPITALDILYGHGASVARGNTFMAHHTGFTAESLGQALTEAGFVNVTVRRDRFDLWARGFKEG
jgi:SAM-dependent methyltransferase